MGSGKGSALTAAEVDENFYGLAQAIDDLAANAPDPVQISSATITGTALTFHMSDGSTVGPLAIPTLRFRWRGDWIGSTAYLEQDTFKVEGIGVFWVLQDHTSEAEFDPSLQIDDTPVYFQLFGVSTLTGLGELADVNLTSIGDAQLLRYDAATGKWLNVTVAEVLDGIGGVRGQILYRGTSAWSVLSPGTSGQFLETLGSGADPAWSDPGAASLPAIANGRVLGNATGSSAAAAETTLSALLDAAIGNTRGSVLYRGLSGWAILTPGIAGKVLQSNGASADPTWETVTGGGGEVLSTT